MGDEKDEFRVIDRRGGGEQRDERPSEKTPPVGAPPKGGAGFTMKEAPPQPEHPQIDFPTLILSLATGALIHLGLTPDPVTRKVSKNLEMARQNIEILQLLKAKTKGNLTADENQMLENLLAEVQLRFVEASKK